MTVGGNGARRARRDGFAAEGELFGLLALGEHVERLGLAGDRGNARVVARDGREFGVGEEAHLAPPFLRISDDKQTMFVRGSGAPQSAAS